MEIKLTTHDLQKMVIALIYANTTKHCDGTKVLSDEDYTKLTRILNDLNFNHCTEANDYTVTLELKED